MNLIEYKPDKHSQLIPISATPRMERIERLKELGERIGLWNISRAEMAKEFGVDRRTIYNDIQEIYKQGIDKECVEQAKVNINNLNRQLLTILQAELIKAKNPRDKAQLAHALVAVEEKITDFLERYGYKEKTPDKLEIASKSINIIINDPKDEYPNIDFPTSE